MSKDEQGRDDERKRERGEETGQRAAPMVQQQHADETGQQDNKRGEGHRGGRHEEGREPPAARGRSITNRVCMYTYTCHAYTHPSIHPQRPLPPSLPPIISLGHFRCPLPPLAALPMQPHQRPIKTQPSHQSTTHRHTDIGRQAGRQAVGSQPCC